MSEELRSLRGRIEQAATFAAIEYVGPDSYAHAAESGFRLAIAMLRERAAAWAPETVSRGIINAEADYLASLLDAPEGGK